MSPLAIDRHPVAVGCLRLQFIHGKNGCVVRLFARQYRRRLASCGWILVDLFVGHTDFGRLGGAQPDFYRPAGHAAEQWPVNDAVSVQIEKLLVSILVSQHSKRRIRTTDKPPRRQPQTNCPPQGIQRGLGIGLPDIRLGQHVIGLGIPGIFGQIVLQLLDGSRRVSAKNLRQRRLMNAFVLSRCDLRLWRSRRAEACSRQNPRQNPHQDDHGKRSHAVDSEAANKFRSGT